jgi:hypothetical protein
MDSGRGAGPEEKPSDDSHELDDENDWDEYEDEIASARALNAWLEYSGREPEMDEDDVGKT